MDLRLACGGDLPRLKAMYRAIAARMEAEGLRIWDEVYPAEFLDGDIKAGRLCVLEDGAEIAAAFALSPSDPGEGRVRWPGGPGKACYLDRLGVDVRYRRQGVGGMALDRAAALAGELGARYLRLFAVECNGPAIALYRRRGFQQALGVYEQEIDGGAVLRERGFQRETAARPSAEKPV